MEEFIINVFNSQAFASGLLVILIVGFGWFINYQVWPFITSRYDKWAEDYITFKRRELEVEAERNNRFADAWRENNDRLAKVNERLIEMNLITQTLVESDRALIGALLSFIDDKKLQGRLYKLFYEDGQ